eukprot:6922039-Pyramimonas_sp.AAC.1
MLVEEIARGSRRGERVHLARGVLLRAPLCAAALAGRSRATWGGGRQRSALLLGLVLGPLQRR